MPRSAFPARARRGHGGHEARGWPLREAGGETATREARILMLMLRSAPAPGEPAFRGPGPASPARMNHAIRKRKGPRQPKPHLNARPREDRPPGTHPADGYPGGINRSNRAQLRRRHHARPPHRPIRRGEQPRYPASVHRRHRPSPRGIPASSRRGYRPPKPASAVSPGEKSWKMKAPRPRAGRGASGCQATRSDAAPAPGWERAARRAAATKVLTTSP